MISFDVIFIILIVLFMVIGLIRGVYKASYRLILTILIIPLAMLLSNSVIEALATVDLSSTTEGAISSINDIGEMIRNSEFALSFPELFVEGSSLNAVVDLWAIALLRFAVTTVIALILFVVFIPVGFILWFIVRLIIPRNIRKNHKLRLVGMAVGAVQGFVIASLLISPLVGTKEFINNLAVAADDIVTTPESEIAGVKDLSEGLNNSIAISTVETMFKNTIIKSANYQFNDSDYNVIIDMESLVLLIAPLDDILESFESLNSASAASDTTNEIQKVVDLFKSLEEPLGKFDDAYKALPENTIVPLVIVEAIPVVLESVAKENEMLANIEISKDMFSVETFSLKDKVVPLLINGAVRSLASEIEALKNVDISNMTYQEIIAEIEAMSKVVSLKDSIGSDTDIENVDPEEIGDAIASIGDSEIAQQIIQESAADIGLTLPEDIDWDNVDYAVEGETVETVIQVYQNTNGGTTMPSSEDCVKLAEALGQSDIAAELIDDIDVQIPTDSATKAQIEAVLVGVDPNKIDNILALFK